MTFVTLTFSCQHQEWNSLCSPKYIVMVVNSSVATNSFHSHLVLQVPFITLQSRSSKASVTLDSSTWIRPASIRFAVSVTAVFSNFLIQAIMTVSVVPPRLPFRQTGRVVNKICWSCTKAKRSQIPPLPCKGGIILFFSQVQDERWDICCSVVETASILINLVHFSVWI